jgi:hypothetical protein
LSSIKESIGTLSASLAVEDEIWQSTDSPLDLPNSGDIPMLSYATENRETHDAIERYVIAAIVDAREVYTDQKWLAWADHWIAGRDRSFASARKAHRRALQACDRESAAMAGCARHCPESDGMDFALTETPAEMAAWAAGLALVATPMAINLTAGIRRMRFALRTGLASMRTAQNVRSDPRSTRPSLVGRAVALARRAASMLMPSEVRQTARP